MCFYTANCSCPILTICFYIADCSWVHTAVEIFDVNILFLFLYIYTRTSYHYISTMLNIHTRKHAHIQTHIRIHTCVCIQIDRQVFCTTISIVIHLRCLFFLTALFQSSFHTWCFLVPQLVGEVTGFHQLGQRQANGGKRAHNTLQQFQQLQEFS